MPTIAIASTNIPNNLTNNIKNPPHPDKIALFQNTLNATDSNTRHAQIEKCVNDGHLTFSEAIYHWQHGNGTPVTVDASRLTVNQSKDFNRDNWAKGVVQGAGDFFVHGRVSLTNTDQGVKIKSEKFDFDQRTDGSWIRNGQTFIGRAAAGEGTPFVINFENSPKIIRDGFDYGQ